MVLIASYVTASAADESPDPPAKPNARDVRLERMTARAQRLKVVVDAEADRKPAARLVEKPLFRYSDPARATTDGTLWLWTHEDRPVASLCLFMEPVEFKKWNYELTLLGPQKLDVTGRPAWRWRPVPRKNASFTPANVAPATNERLRLSQMKRILRDLKAVEDLDGERSELRLLTRPVHRYTSKKHDVVDGAIFLFVYGVNPEIIARIEARSDGNSTVWKVNFHPATAAALDVRNGDKTIWSADRVKEWDDRAAYYSAYGPDPLDGDAGE